MSLPLLAEALLRELALEVEKRSGADRALIESLMQEIRTLGEALSALARNELDEMDLARLLSGIKAGFDDDHVRAAVRQAQDNCARFFENERQKRAPGRDLLLGHLVTDVESVMLALVNVATRSF